MIQKIKAESFGRYFLLTVLCCLFIFVILKAFHLSFTHDESLSFKILQGDRGVARTANNHLLNSWLMTFFYWLFGAREFVLRLPNVLAFCFYAFFSYKILSKSGNLVLLLSGTALLLFNPYMLDFFTIARGYGLSLGFTMATIYFLLQNNRIDSYKGFIRNFSLALAFSIMAAYSSFIMVNFSIAVLLIFMLDLYLLVRKGNIRLSRKRGTIVFLVIFLGLVLLSILMFRLIMLKSNHELYFGGTSFFRHTITQLIHHSIYFSYYGELFWIGLRQAIVIIFVLGIVYQLTKIQYNSLSRITILLSLMIIASYIQFQLFDTLYPVGRTALIFIPLFGLFVFFFVCELLKLSETWSIAKPIIRIVLFILCVPVIVHFISNMNLKYTREWKFDANTKSVMAEIKSQNDLRSTLNRHISMSNNWLFEPTINYYRTIYRMDYLYPANRDGLDQNSDFIYCSIEEMKTFQWRELYLVVMEFEDTETVLLRKIVADVPDSCYYSLILKLND